MELKSPNLQLSGADKLVFHLANLTVSASGLVYAWMLYLLEPIDEFSILNHPWQDHMRNLHILFAPLLVFAGAMLWKHHVWARLQSGRKRKIRSGILLTVAIFPMIFSGYLLQIAVSEEWRQIWLVLHLSTSALWLVAAFFHFIPIMMRLCAGATR